MSRVGQGIAHSLVILILMFLIVVPMLTTSVLTTIPIDKSDDAKTKSILATSVYASSDNSSDPPIRITRVDPWSPLRFAEEISRNPCYQDVFGHDFPFSWYEVSNVVNETLSIAMEGAEFSYNRTTYFDTTTLDPGESCQVVTADFISQRNGHGGSEGFVPPEGVLEGGESVFINYTVPGNTRYGGTFKDTTPPLPDPHGDLAYWELDLESNKWIFKDEFAGRRNQEKLTLTSVAATNGPNQVPLIVNITLPQEVRAQSIVELELKFIDSRTMKVVDRGTVDWYTLEFEGDPESDDPDQREGGGYSSGREVNGKFMKLLLIGEMEPINFAVVVTPNDRWGLENTTEGVSQPQVAKFVITVVPEFGPAVPLFVISAAVVAVITMTRRTLKP